MEVLFHQNTSSHGTLYETFPSKQETLKTSDLASGLKWSTMKSESETDHIMKHQKGTPHKLLL